MITVFIGVYNDISVYNRDPSCLKLFFPGFPGHDFGFS